MSKALPGKHQHAAKLECHSQARPQRKEHVVQAAIMVYSTAENWCTELQSAFGGRRHADRPLLGTQPPPFYLASLLACFYAWEFGEMADLRHPVYVLNPSPRLRNWLYLIDIVENLLKIVKFARNCEIWSEL